MIEKKLPSLTFKTKNLEVRPLEKTDFSGWSLAFRNRLPKQNQFDESFILEEDCDESNFEELVELFKQRSEKGQIFQLFAFHQETGEVIGSVQCSLIQRFDVQKAYLGYGVLNNHWRRGFGFEIADGMIDHAFQELKLHRLEAEILPSNIVSIQLSKKLGMSSEGIRRKSVYVDGEWQDHEVFAIIAEDRSILDMEPNKSLI